MKIKNRDDPWDKFSWTFPMTSFKVALWVSGTQVYEPKFVLSIGTPQPLKLKQFVLSMLG